MRAAKRIERRPVPDSIQALSQFHPVLARVYAARRIVSPAQVGTVLTHLHRADSLSQIDHAAELLARAVCEGQRILIVGDFDADGATSCALGVRALRAMGARDVQYLVPNRFEYGYGLTPEIVALAEQRAPRVVVTVDNGISSHEGVAAAKAAGMVVVITDHHLPGPALPPADAIVNPNQPGDGFPSKHLAGVGVIFYVLSALRAKLREADWFEVSGLGPPNLAQWLDLVALGTVADVVPLDDNNRILVAQGVARIRRGHCLPGVLALLEAAGRFHERVVASDLGYAVAPRLNAAGRLEDMSLGIECLLADDLEAARASARELDALNHARRGIEREMQEQALSLLQDIALDGDATQLPAGLCLYDSRWHQGVIGILAGRIKDRVHRPVIALADVGAGELKGSARSIPGVHIRDVLDAVAARHPQLLRKFGGHAMAAGLSLPQAHMETFRRVFDEEVRRCVTEDDLSGVIYSDGELAGDELSVDTAELLREAGPWGQGFPEPLFDGEFELVERRIVGAGHLKMVLRARDTGGRVDAIAFGQTDDAWPADVRRVHVAYRLRVNEFQGRRSVQLNVEQVSPVKGAAKFETAHETALQ